MRDLEPSGSGVSWVWRVRTSHQSRVQLGDLLYQKQYYYYFRLIGQDGVAIGGRKPATRYLVETVGVANLNIYHYRPNFLTSTNFPDGLVVMISACQQCQTAGDRGSIPRRGETSNFFHLFLLPFFFY